MNFDEYVQSCSAKLQKDGFEVHSKLSEIPSNFLTKQSQDSTEIQAIEDGQSVLTNVKTLAFLHKGYPIDFLACAIGYFEASPSLKQANEYSTSVYTFSSKYAKALIRGNGNSRLFFPVFVSERFDDEFLRRISSRDPMRTANRVKGLGGTYLHLVFPILAELDPHKITYYPKKNFFGRMYYGKMQEFAKKYFEFWVDSKLKWTGVANDSLQSVF